MVSRLYFYKLFYKQTPFCFVNLLNLFHFHLDWHVNWQKIGKNKVLNLSAVRGGYFCPPWGKPSVTTPQSNDTELKKITFTNSYYKVSESQKKKKIQGYFGWLRRFGFGCIWPSTAGRVKSINVEK